MQNKRVSTQYRLPVWACLWVLMTLCYPPLQVSAQEKSPVEVVVAKDGSGDFTSIQKAIESSKSYPPKRLVIRIKNGVYEEAVRIPVWNPDITLIGESRDSTIIRQENYFGKVHKGRNSTFYTATMRIEASGIRLQHLSIENSAGPVGQAIALLVSGDRCILLDCKIKGHQDTFFATGEHTRVYLQDCYISGTTDFLFGDATVLLYKCQLYCLSDSYIVAASTNKGQPYGFVMDHCSVLAAPGVGHVLLGRPWRPYARTVWLNAQMGSFIAPAGWDNWRDTANQKTAYYAEYASKGKGARPEMRAKWSHQLTQRQASKYAHEKILGNWIADVPDIPANTKK